MKWREFISGKPEHSIALDGYVSVGPRFNFRGTYGNFNHHEEVSRLETRATCAQILLAVRMGLMDAYMGESGNTEMNIYVNDCDEDVSLSVFILRNAHLAIGTMNPLLNKLVHIEDMMDTTAGAYPFPKELESLQEIMWVLAPYHKFRMGGGLDSRDAGLFEEVIDEVGDRVMSYITGNSRKIELDTRFTTLGGGEGWSLISEEGQNARVGVYDKGIRAFVSVRKREDDNWTYVLGRSSQFVFFPIPVLLKQLNEAEGNKHGDVWGGSDTIAGSPRIAGSKLDPDTVCSIVDQTLLR